VPERLPANQPTAAVQHGPIGSPFHDPRLRPAATATVCTPPSSTRSARRIR